jgi:hypothetical protein
MAMGMSGGGMMSMADTSGMHEGFRNLAGAISEYSYKRRLSKDLARISGDQAQAEMFRAGAAHKDVIEDIGARRRLQRDITRMTSPAEVQRRAAEKPDFGEEATALTRRARAGGGGRASLAAARLGRLGYQRAQVRNIGEAQEDIGQDVQERISEERMAAEERMAKRRKRQMLFDMFSTHLGMSKQRAAASAAKHKSKLDIISGALIPQY